MIIGCDYYTRVEWIGVGYNKPGDGLLSVGKLGHGDRSSSEDATFVTFLGSQLYHGAVDARCLSLLQVELSGIWVGYNKCGVHCCR